MGRSGTFLVAVAVGLAVGLVAVAATVAGPPGAFEPGEERPGGDTTARAPRDARAFSHPAANLPPDLELDFRVGDILFRKTWLPAPADVDVGAGLGPLFNASSCEACHRGDGRGMAPDPGAAGGETATLVLRLSIPTEDGPAATPPPGSMGPTAPEPTYGHQLQDRAIDGHAPEGRLVVAYEEARVSLPGGETVVLRRPTYRIDELAYGPLHPLTLISPRVAPPTIGLGLLEAVPEATILEWADPDDRDGDGVSGRPGIVRDARTGRPALGRFGWKASVATVEEQVALALSRDMGLSNPAAPEPGGDCTERQARCRQAPHGGGASRGGLEVGAAMVEALAVYARNLAVPPRPDAADPDVLAGKAAFHAIGCARCHRPTLVTGEVPGAPHLSRQTVWPYTDLLLHDMGDGLADGRPEGAASGNEWRTAPLWGIGPTGAVGGRTQFLHDGRARSLTEAVLWHGGEARPARDRFAALRAPERAALLAFLGSL